MNSKKIAYYLIALTTIYSLSCSNVGNNGVDFDGERGFKTEVVLAEENVFLNYLFVNDDTYFLEWGNDNMRLQSKDSIRVLPGGEYRVMKYSDNGIFIKQSCGSACSIGYVLPIVENAKEKLYEYPLTVDLENGLIVYSSKSEDGFLTVENYLTHETLDIKKSYLKGPYPAWSIEEIEFMNPKELFIKWRTEQDSITQDTVNVSI